MQNGLVIEYIYSGDDAAWRSAIETFVGHIRKDARLTGAFSYVVVRRKDDPTRRLHMPRWDSPETLAYVQSQSWFKAFAEQVKQFAGDSMKTSPMTVEFDTRS